MIYICKVCKKEFNFNTIINYSTYYCECKCYILKSKSFGSLLYETILYRNWEILYSFDIKKLLLLQNCILVKELDGILSDNNIEDWYVKLRNYAVFE
jgi:hypothetical protein